MTRQNVSRQVNGGAMQLSLFPDPTSEAPTGGPSALEKASWSNQFNPAVRQLLLNEPVTEEVMLFHIERSEWKRKMFDWGTAQDYPEFHLRIDGRVASVIAPGRSEWIRFCTVGDGFLMSQVCWQLKKPPFWSDIEDQPVDVSLDQKTREEVMAFGRQRGWNYCLINHAAIPERNQTVTLFIGNGEKNWWLFAQCVDSAYVSQMLSMLRREVVRDTLYEEACAAGWPSYSYTLAQFCEPRPIVLNSELTWRFFCAHERFEYVTSAYETLFKIRGMAL